MTEDQAAELIVQVKLLVDLAEAIAHGVTAAAGLLLTIITRHALVTKRFFGS